MRTAPITLKPKDQINADDTIKLIMVVNELYSEVEYLKSELGHRSVQSHSY